MRTISAWGIVILGAASATAQDTGRPSDRALAPLVACRGLADMRAKASCYDTALDRLQQSVGDRQVVIMDREQVSADRRNNFGLLAERPRIAPIKSARTRTAPSPAAEEPTAIDATLVSALPTGYDLWTMRLSTGATWRTTEPGLAFPRTGDVVHIRRGAMGGFLLRIGKGKTVRAMRVG